MFRHESLFTVVATLLSSFFLAAIVFLSPDIVRADDTELAGPPCACGESQKKSTKPKFAGLSDTLDEGDEIAALESVQQALNKVGDGASYVWHRANGRLSGLVQPTRSFRNSKGEVCRHLVILLTTGDKTNKAEGIACRDADGRWALEG
jgi:surface antigen